MRKPAMTMPVADERRAAKRFRAYQYTAYIKRCGWLGKVRAGREAAVLDFNRYGAGLCCDSRFKVGEQLELSICSSSEKVSNIQAEVCYLRRERGECFVGLRFVQQDSTAIPDSTRMSVLAGMERVILQQLV